MGSSLGFQVRDWTSYTQTMASWIASNPSLVPGFNLPSDMIEGSLERAHLEALAMVMEDYDIRAQKAVDYAANNAVYNAFGFPYLSASPSLGQVTFTALVAPAANIDIPTGTKLGTSTGVQFVTTQDATLEAGSFTVVSVPVQAATTGTATNVPASSISRILYPIAGVDQVTNPQATCGGTDPETPAARQTRFQSWVNTLTRGTLQALEYASVSVAQCGVIDALAVEPFNMTPPQGSVGNVWVFLDNGLGSAVVPGAIASAINGTGGVGGVMNGYPGPNNTFVPGWAAAGIQVILKPVLYANVFLTAAVVTNSHGKGRFGDIQAALSAAATTYFNAVTIGQPVIYHELLVALSLADPDIQSITLQMGLESTPGTLASLIWNPSAGGMDNTVYATLASHPILFGSDFTWNQNDPVQVGSRYVLQNDATYPIWNLS
jgi:uncharacterized phage protein gp47/JayE